jgi:SET domain-containing protein
LEDRLFVTVSRSELHGHGCFTTRAIDAGEEVAECRALLFPPEETAQLMQTNLKNYLFFVRDDAVVSDTRFHSALAMGPVSFCNHSAEATCDFHVDEAKATITLVARRPLAAHEEITIDYGDYAEAIL